MLAKVCPFSCRGSFVKCGPDVWRQLWSDCRFGARTSGVWAIDAGNRLTFSAEEIGKVSHVRVERGRRVRRARSPTERGAECRPPCRRRRRPLAEAQPTPNPLHTESTNHYTRIIAAVNLWNGFKYK